MKLNSNKFNKMTKMREEVDQALTTTLMAMEALMSMVVLQVPNFLQEDKMR
jgi:hypothetical protein